MAIQKLNKKNEKDRKMHKYEMQNEKRIKGIMTMLHSFIDLI